MSCQKPDCNNPKIPRRKYCETHRTNKKANCIHPECKTKPSFGIAASGKPQYCSKHSPLHYVNVKDKTCIHPECKTIPVYGLKGSSKPQYCKTHCPTEYVNVKSKTCIHLNCKTRPSYGIPTYSVTHCAKHKAPNMVKNPTKFK